MNLPFVLERIKLPKINIKTDSDTKKYCYVCNKKIKIEKGYKTFQRQQEHGTDVVHYVCHRDLCYKTLNYAVSKHNYNIISTFASFDYF